MQLMASMSSVGGGDSLRDIWAMMESGLSPRSATPRHRHADSMCVCSPLWCTYGASAWTSGDSGCVPNIVLGICNLLTLAMLPVLLVDDQYPNICQHDLFFVLFVWPGYTGITVVIVHQKHLMADMHADTVEQLTSNVPMLLRCSTAGTRCPIRVYYGRPME